MRTCSGTTCASPLYILSDHLGSSTLVTNASGAVVAEMKYKAWGEERFSSGTMPTDYTYTGQFSYAGVGGFGLMYYNARWYDPALGRFSQADSIIPAGVQGYDRYAYVNNNPLRYTDPSGHCIEAVSCLVFVDIVLVTLTISVVLATAHVVLPGMDERNKAVASVLDQASLFAKGKHPRNIPIFPKILSGYSPNGTGGPNPEDYGKLLKELVKRHGNFWGFIMYAIIVGTLVHDSITSNVVNSVNDDDFVKESGNRDYIIPAKKKMLPYDDERDISGLAIQGALIPETGLVVETENVSYYKWNGFQKVEMR